MNKLDRNLIDNKGLSSADKNNFQEYVHSQVKLEKPKGFDEFITRWYIIALLIMMSIVTIIGGGILLMSIFILGVIILIMGIVSVIMTFKAFKTRKKFFNNAFSKIDILDITKKWFSYYGIKDDKVTNDTFKEIDNYVSIFRKSPSDATVIASSGSFTITNENMESTFIMVNWHWTRTYRDSKGNYRTRHHYLSQFYSFDRNFNKKWDGFEFALGKGKTIFKRKAESLENELFNKSFNYKYNNPVKLRQAFTPSVQENILNKFTIRDLSITKTGDTIISTSTSAALGPGFTPFQINPGSAVLDENVIKQKLFNDLYGDFSLLMIFMGHSRMIYPLYRK